MRLAALFCLFALALSVEAAGPPVARRADVVDRSFGLEMPDPYRWMEADAGRNKELIDWLEAHSARTRRWLDERPSQTRWRATLGAGQKDQVKRQGYVRRGEQVFFLWSAGGAPPALVVRDRRGRERVLFDPTGGGERAALLSFAPSIDGRRIVMAVSEGGSEASGLQVLDVASGKRLDGGLGPVWGQNEPSWLPDGSGFFYNRMSIDPETGKPSLQRTAVFLHRVGTPQSEDRRIVGAGDDGAIRIAAQDLPMLEVTPGSEWAQLYIGGARATYRVCVTPVKSLLRDGNAPTAWRCPVEEDANVQAVAVHRDTMFLRQLKGAPNGKIVALDLRNPKVRIDQAEVVLPERSDAVLVTLIGARDALYVRYLKEGAAELRRVDYRTRADTPVQLPAEGGNARMLQGHAASDGVTFSFEGWILPAANYEYRPSERRLVALDAQQAVSVDVSAMVVERSQARSADGTSVPLTVLHRRDHKRDGSALAIVMGYGGYGIGMRPAFDPDVAAWVDAGHLYAICHVRGGDEKGDFWRVGGSGANKQRGVEDFIACAKTLAQRGDTSPRRTGAMGYSLAGVLIGGAYVTDPEAFGAVAIGAGEFNVTRLEAQDSGPNHYAELGDPRTETGMRQLLAMDPYQRVRDGVRYPPILLSFGIEDQRVNAWQSGKFAARVMAASPDTTVLVRAQHAAGHVLTADREYSSEYADFFTMFESVLGAE